MSFESRVICHGILHIRSNSQYIRFLYLVGD